MAGSAFRSCQPCRFRLADTISGGPEQPAWSADHGYSVAPDHDPDPESDRGLSASMRQDAGSSESTMNGLLTSGLPEAAESSDSTRWTTGFAHGLPVIVGPFAGIPHAGIEKTGNHRDDALGWRMTPAGPQAPGISFDIDATRRERTMSGLPTTACGPIWSSNGHGKDFRLTPAGHGHGRAAIGQGQKGGTPSSQAGRIEQRGWCITLTRVPDGKDTAMVASPTRRHLQCVPVSVRQFPFAGTGWSHGEFRKRPGLLPRLSRSCGWRTVRHRLPR